MIGLLLSIGVAVAGPRWSGLGDFVSPGPLSAPHAHLSGIRNCTQCHAAGVGIEPSRCLACHEDVQEQVRTGRGFHRNRGDVCGTCHPDHRGGDFPLVRLDEKSFDHGRETRFKLEGAHADLECTDCHRHGAWTEADPECASCHEEPHRKVSRARELASCESCHGVSDWKVPRVLISVFDHNDPGQADYALKGGHVIVECIDCHVDAVFAPIRHEACESCHADPHKRPLGNSCESCHVVERWKVPGFDHDITDYRLEGEHREVSCRDCHGNSVTRPLPFEQCIDCHKDPHRKQFDPDPCELCHAVTLADFGVVDSFDHDETDFPLVGQHVEVTCKECHGSGTKGKYRDRPHADCDDCHEDIHEGSFEPTACRVCHVEQGWGVEDFDHNRTDFPLVGEHQAVECVECHPDEQWSGIRHDLCVDCHTEHPHGTAFPPPGCDVCHEPTGWATMLFDHLVETEYDLAPQHSALPCMNCHVTPDNFAGLSTVCKDCHQDTRPFGHYPGECETCHQGARWVPAGLGDLDHSATGFPLRGAHSMLECVDCHGEAWVPHGSVDTSCASCHADDDIHRNMLGPRCERCHTETAWFRTRFRHQETGWPLRGAHRLVACVDCHAVSYAGTPQACRACHQYNAPLDIPAHQGASFHQCDRCHRPFTWSVVSQVRP